MEFRRASTDQGIKERFVGIAHRIIEHFAVPHDESIRHFLGAPEDGRQLVHNLQNGKRADVHFGDSERRWIGWRGFLSHEVPKDM